MIIKLDNLNFMNSWDLWALRNAKALKCSIVATEGIIGLCIRSCERPVSRNWKAIFSSRRIVAEFVQKKLRFGLPRVSIDVCIKCWDKRDKCCRCLDGRRSPHHGFLEKDGAELWVGWANAIVSVIDNRPLVRLSDDVSLM